MPEINRNAFPASRRSSSEARPKPLGPTLPSNQSALGVDIPAEDLDKLRKKLESSLKDLQNMKVLTVIGLLTLVGLLIANLGSLLFYVKDTRIRSNRYMKPVLQELSGLSRKELKELSGRAGFRSLVAEYVLKRSNAYWPMVITGILLAVIGIAFVYLKVVR